MYILPTPTHLEVVALGGSSDIFFSDILIMNRTRRVSPRLLAESCSKMVLLPTTTCVEVGGPAAASKIIRYGHFNYEPIRCCLC